MIASLLRPLQPFPLLLTLAIATAATTASLFAGSLGIDATNAWLFTAIFLGPAAIVLAGMLARYGWLITQATALGHTRAPVPGAAEISPFGHPAFVLLAGIGFACWWLAARWDSPAATPAAVLIAALLPALCITANFSPSVLGGLRPGPLAAVIGGLGLRYMLLIALTYAWLGVLVAGARFGWSVFGSTWLAGYVFLVCAHVAGICLYDRRHLVGIEANAGEDLERAQAARATERTIARLRQDAHQLAAADDMQGAVALLTDATRRDGTDFGLGLHAAFDAFQYPAVVRGWTSWLLRRLVDLQRFDDVWTVFRTTAARGEPVDFDLDSNRLLVLASRAPPPQRRQLRDLLMRAIDTPTRNDERPALLLACARLSSHLGEPAEVRRRLAQLRDEHADYVGVPAVRQEIDQLIAAQSATGQ